MYKILQTWSHLIILLNITSSQLINVQKWKNKMCQSELCLSQFLCQSSVWVCCNKKRNNWYPIKTTTELFSVTSFEKIPWWKLVWFLSVSSLKISSDFFSRSLCCWREVLPWRSLWEPVCWAGRRPPPQSKTHSRSLFLSLRKEQEKSRVHENNRINKP